MGAAGEKGWQVKFAARSLLSRHWFSVAAVAAALFAATSSARITVGQLFAALF